jgi:hypothetical protein
MQPDLDAGNADIQCLGCLVAVKVLYIAKKENLTISVRKSLDSLL